MPENKPDQSQVDKFRQLARELEADEDEERFEDQVRRIATKGQPGAWHVKQLKDGTCAPSFAPHGFAPEWEGPSFQTEAEARAWIERVRDPK